jgi:flagellar biosynthesis protein FliR
MVVHHHRAPLVIAGLVFLLVAIGHLLRIIYQLDIIIAGQPISMMVSYVGLVVAALLSAWMFLSACCCGRKTH